MKKRKIIFSDFFDTLAGRDIRYGNESANSQYQVIEKFLKEYLQENNLMFILSSIDHSTLDDFVKIYINLSSVLDEAQKKRFWFYVVGCAKESYIRPSNFFNVVNNNKDEMTKKIIEDMAIGENDSLISAGNDGKDIDMLFRINSMGGTSYFVNEKCFDDIKEMSDDELIRSISSKKATSIIKKGNSSINANGRILDHHNLTNMIYHDIKERFTIGEIDRKNLEKMHSSFNIALEYNWCHIADKKTINEEDVLKKLVLVNNREDIFLKLRESSKE